MKQAIVIRPGFEHYIPGQIIQLTDSKFRTEEGKGTVKEYQKIKAITGHRTEQKKIIIEEEE